MRHEEAWAVTCGAQLDVPEGMRAAALEVARGLSDEVPLPVCVTCELDQHDHGEHAARLRELFEGAVWVMWEGGDITVRPLDFCAALHPNRGHGDSMCDALCWLHDAHQGGHTWERCA